MNTVQKIDEYITSWTARGYKDGIPDEVPSILMKNLLAPSYKAIATAILKNDMHMESLGYSTPNSKWYSQFKKVEIEQRNKDEKEIQEKTEEMASA